MAKETHVEALLRWRKLELLQETYPHFVPFLDDMMHELGFETSLIQQEIGEFLEYGPMYIMVQAQRGQAKSTVSAIFCVWHLIHNPTGKVLIISAGEKQSNEISTLIVRLINNVDVLECMRPDPRNGDRVSVEAFDIHYSLKGIDKSPSVACVGIGGNLQGKRATLLLADDVESKKNSKTAGARADLLDLTRDFTSICETGRIIYLGTPQTQDSIYNTLPSRGFTIRVWPGRYPTPEQESWYGDFLAPGIRKRMSLDPSLRFGGGALGDQGQATDTRLDEEVLQKKEMDQGPAYFQLQHMLSTAMSDALRYPLKTENLVVMRLNREKLPLSITRTMTEAGLMNFSVHGHSFRMSTAHEVSEDTAPPDTVIMYVDPAAGGKNGDETGYAILAGLNGNAFLLDVGGIPGGYTVEQMEFLTDLAAKWKPNEIVIEKNLGYGAFKEVWLPVLRKKYKTASIIDDYVTGQKELRIAEGLEPVMARGSLIVDQSCVENDQDTISRYHVGKRLTFSFFFQLGRLTRDRNCLAHDDRLDAVEGAVRRYLQGLAIDQEHELKRRREAELAKWMADPLLHNRYSSQPKRRASTLDRFRR
jgi:hypothetical protein